MPLTASSFALEDEMLPYLRSSGVVGIFENGNKKIVVSEKVQVGGIIPDLVFALSSCSSSIQPSKKRLTHFECAVLSEIVKHSAMTLQSLCCNLYASTDRLDLAIKNLSHRGLIKVSNGQVKAVKSKIPKVRIISIEAKLTRWREALEQAIEYLHFSNSAYIAMPEHVLFRMPIIAASCKKAGVGLLSVDKENVKLVVKGKVQNVSSGEWLWTIDRMAAD
jgi:hypothetical protein